MAGIGVWLQERLRVAGPGRAVKAEVAGTGLGWLAWLEMLLQAEFASLAGCWARWPRLGVLVLVTDLFPIC